LALKELKFRPGVLSYKPGTRFKNSTSGIPGPGSYSPGHELSSSVERARGGKWGVDRKKDMVLRGSVGKQHINQHLKFFLTLCHILNNSHCFLAQI